MVLSYLCCCHSCPTLCNPMDCNTPRSPVLSVQFSCSVVFDSLRPHESQHARPPCPSPTAGVQPSSHLILCSPLLLLLPIPPSSRVFSNESTLRLRWPKYWSFSFSISPSNEHPGLIFRMGWLALLAVQGTLKSLLQHHSSKASILRRSAVSKTLTGGGRVEKVCLEGRSTSRCHRRSL